MARQRRPPRRSGLPSMPAPSLRRSSAPLAPSAVEAETHSIKGPQPHVAFARTILTVQRPPRRLDADEAERFRGEGQWPFLDEGGLCGPRALAVEQVDHHFATEPAGGD